MGSIDKERDNRRTTLIAKAELSWEDNGGMLHVSPGTMEDTSRGGACIRVPTEFQVGTKLTVKRRTEQFSGVVKYCREDAEDFVIGVERDIRPNPIDGPITAAPRPVSISPPVEPPPEIQKTQTTAPPRPVESVPPQSAPIQPPPIQPKLPESKLVEPATIKPTPAEPAPTEAQPPEPAQVAPESFEPGLIANETAPPTPMPMKAREIPRVTPPNPASDLEITRHIPRPEEPNPVRLAEALTQDTVEKKERTTMDTKWLHLPSRRRPQAVPNGGASLEPGIASHKDSVPAKPQVANASTKTSARTRGNLLSLEDIYRAAGIAATREGCSINRVVEMLDNDHIRDLSEDVKRASVMMALESSGISIADVLKDATLRLDALGGYEANQRNLLEEYESRKASENAQIQAEMERETARYLERIKQNLAEVATEKETLLRWQSTKQREAQRISEAVGVCNKRAVSDVPSQPIQSLHGIGVVGKSS